MPELVDKVTKAVSENLRTDLTFYNNFSAMLKQGSEFGNSYMNGAGCLISADPFFIYIDVAAGRNHPWLGGDFTDGLADGGGQGGWHTRLNINVGIYF